MEPEDDCLWGYGTDQQQMLAPFTDRGPEYLRELVAEYRHNNTSARASIRSNCILNFCQAGR